MKLAQQLALPQAEQEYKYINEQQLRRSVEMAFEDLRNDVIATRESTDKDVTLGRLRHHFLLMGAT